MSITVSHSRYAALALSILIGCASETMTGDLDETTDGEYHESSDGPGYGTSGDEQWQETGGEPVDPTTPQDIDHVPESVVTLAVEMLPTEATTSGYALHYHLMEVSEETERYRASYSLLARREHGHTANKFGHSAEIIFNRATGEASLVNKARGTQAGEGWTSLATINAIEHDILVVRMFEAPSYSTGSDYYSLRTDITTTGIIHFSIPNLDTVNMHDRMSSFYSRDAVCNPSTNCRVGDWVHDVHDFIVYKHIDFNSSDWYDFGNGDYDDRFHNNRWRNDFWEGRIDNKASSAKIKMSVLSAPVVCGDGVCEGAEAAPSCHGDCGACGDGICSGPETAYSCHGDCGYCGDLKCTGPETVIQCPSDCGICGDGICSGTETAHSCHSDCGYCGDGICSGGETPASCTQDCDPECLVLPCDCLVQPC